jgi:DASH complex subunit SPC19
MPEPFVAAKKASYAASLQPYIDKLLDRAAELVDAEEARVSRKEDQLAYLEQLITARLPASAPLPHTFKHLDPAGEGLGSVARTRFLEGVEPAGPAQRRRIGMLKMKREKLERERERLLGE